jgi:hypothetical protein
LNGKKAIPEGGKPYKTCFLPQKNVKKRSFLALFGQNRQKRQKREKMHLKSRRVFSRSKISKVSKVKKTLCKSRSFFPKKGANSKTKKVEFFRFLGLGDF